MSMPAHRSTTASTVPSFTGRTVAAREGYRSEAVYSHARGNNPELLAQPQRLVLGRARSHQSIDDVTRTAEHIFIPHERRSRHACFRGLPGPHTGSTEVRL